MKLEDVVRLRLRSGPDLRRAVTFRKTGGRTRAVATKPLEISTLNPAVTTSLILCGLGALMVWALLATENRLVAACLAGAAVFLALTTPVARYRVTPEGIERGSWLGVKRVDWRDIRAVYAVRESRGYQKGLLTVNHVFIIFERAIGELKVLASDEKVAELRNWMHLCGGLELFEPGETSPVRRPSREEESLRRSGLVAPPHKSAVAIAVVAALSTWLIGGWF